MQFKNSLAVWLSAVLMTAMLSGCSSWVYRISIPQGNFLEQNDVDKLRVKMTQEQVLYVLGSPVAKDAFSNESWHYSYTLNIGRDSELRKSLVVHFENGLLAKITGDFETPENFNTPLEG
jgi:outer membrane protein assembly factor BamE